MVEFIICVGFLAATYYLCQKEDWKASHRLPPNGKEIDYGSITRDVVNGMSKNDIYKKMNKGGYDVPNK